MALEKPQVRANVEFGNHLSLAVSAAVLADPGDAVEHQHRRQGQLGIARTKHLAAGAGQQIVEFQ